jgi:hypothetical protein
MKRLLVVLLALGILGGCSSTPDIQTTGTQNNAKTEQQNEDNYIKTTIESANQITDNIDKLKALFAGMDIENDSWQLDAQIALDKIGKAKTDYLLGETKLSSEQKQKYKNTISYFNEGISSLDQVDSDARKALDTYDKKVISEISSKLDDESAKIQKAKEQLDTERYKE